MQPALSFSPPAVARPVAVPKRHPLVLSAARAACKAHAALCQVDVDDAWNLFAETFLADAETAIQHLGVDRMLEALELVAQKKPVCGVYVLDEQDMRTVRTAVVAQGAAA